MARLHIVFHGGCRAPWWKYVSRLEQQLSVSTDAIRKLASEVAAIGKEMERIKECTMVGRFTTVGPTSSQEGVAAVCLRLRNATEVLSTSSQLPVHLLMS